MDDEPPADTGATNSRKRKSFWKCKLPGCKTGAQTGCKSMCKKHFSEFKRAQNNNNELSQSNNDAQSKTKNEVSQSSNDAQQGAIVLAGLSNHVSNGRKATHVQVVSDQQNNNSVIETEATDEEQPVDVRVRTNNTSQRGVASDEAPVVGEQAQRMPNNTTQRKAASDEAPVVGEQAQQQNRSVNLTVEAGATDDIPNDQDVRENNTIRGGVATEETQVVVDQALQAETSYDANELAHVVSTIPSATTSLLERIISIEEENRFLRDRINTLENSVNTILNAGDNEKLNDRISTLERKVKQLTKPSSLSLATISATHHGSALDNDNIIGTFTTFESIKPMTAATWAPTITKRKSGPNAGLVNSGNLCYSNAILQAFASCQQITTLSGNPSPKNLDNIRLCYEFTTLLTSMMTEETVNPSAYTGLIQERYTRFVDVESEYYICNPISIDKHIKNLISCPQLLLHELQLKAMQRIS